MLDIYEYYQKMRANNIVLAYKGNVSDDLFDCLLELAESKLNKIELKIKLKKKVFNILVEILQNIYHHFGKYSNLQEEKYSVIFLLIKEAKGYTIISGNCMDNKDVEALKKKIDNINAMSLDELKVLYRQRLQTGEMSEKGGAGLGMLDMVRKSGGKIKYNFRTIDQDSSFFSLQIKVSA